MLRCSKRNVVLLRPVFPALPFSKILHKIQTTYFSYVPYEKCQKREPSSKKLPYLWTPVHLAQKMGKGMGGSQVLQRTMQAE